MSHETERSNPRQEDVAASAARSPRNGRARPLVLIVDDDADARAIHAEILAQRGFRSAEAGDGETGIAMAIAAVPDVILIDYSMPGMTGAEVAHRLKRDTRASNIPIVMFTGLSFSQAAVSSRDCDAYIPKPSSADAIAAALRSVLAVQPSTSKKER